MMMQRHTDPRRLPAPLSVRGHLGFTLIELVVTVAVGAILTAIAIPAFQSFVMNDRDSAQVNSLAYSFNYARSEAVKQDLAGGVTVCPSNGGGLPCNGAAWQQGWIVYYTDANGVNQILQTVPALSSNNSNTVTAGGSANAAVGITFLSSGMATGLAGPITPAPLQIRVCDQRGATYARDVEVNTAGRVAASQKVGFAADQVTPLVCP
jgi:type IV fimbrial biogenesis protein FimT